MAASGTDEELAEATSGMVGGLHRDNSRPLATQDGRVVPERSNASRLLLRLPEILCFVFHGHDRALITEAHLLAVNADDL